MLLVLAALASAAPLSAQTHAWHLSPAPSLSIGREGDGHEEFSRINGVVRTSEGQVVVANSATNELRVFDSKGDYLRTLGRSGAGPGEFKSITWFGRLGDTLTVFDQSNRRITAYLASGKAVGTLALTARDNDGRQFYIFGRLANGRWLAHTFAVPTLEGSQRIYRDTMSIGTIPPDAAGRVAWLGRFPGATFFVYNPSGGSHGEIVAWAPLSASSVVGHRGNEILVGDSRSNQLQLFTASGRPSAKISLPIAPSPVTEQAIARLRDRALTEMRNPQESGYIGALYRKSILSGTMPLYRDLLTGTDGYLWVELYAIEPTEPTAYLVVDPAGRVVATVSTPAGFRIKEAGRDYLIGVHTDANGIETVQLYGLSR